MSSMYLVSPNFIRIVLLVGNSLQLFLHVPLFFSFCMLAFFLTIWIACSPHSSELLTWASSISSIRAFWKLFYLPKIGSCLLQKSLKRLFHYNLLNHEDDLTHTYLLNYSCNSCLRHKVHFWLTHKQLISKKENANFQ